MHPKIITFIVKYKLHKDLYINKSINQSLCPNWFPTLLALQDTGALHTAWRYSDLITVLYGDGHVMESRENDNKSFYSRKI